MAIAIHTKESLDTIKADLLALVARVETLQNQMEEVGVTDVPFNHEAAQMRGRAAVHEFLSDGTERLRRIVVENQIKASGG